MSFTTMAIGEEGNPPNPDFTKNVRNADEDEFGKRPLGGPGHEEGPFGKFDSKDSSSTSNKPVEEAKKDSDSSRKGGATSTSTSTSSSTSKSGRSDEFSSFPKQDFPSSETGGEDVPPGGNEEFEPV